MPTSTTLFLLTCSNNKRPDGGPAYDPALGIAAKLEVKLKPQLEKARQTVLQIILENNARRHDVGLGDFPRNAKLVSGADFGGSDKSANLSAAERYNGSFYRAMGEDASKLLLGTKHHILILSGLYGLVRAAEPIQNYSCHINDDPAIRPLWQDSRLLTEILLDYLKQNAISQIFDFTALRGYRELINWNTVQQRRPLAWVRHAFGAQTVGDGLLTPLGELLGKWLRAADDVALNEVASKESTDIKTDAELIHFSSDDQPPQNYPREPSPISQVADRKDEIVRLARCVKYLLAYKDNQIEMSDLHPVIDSLESRQEVDAATARAMHAILKRRDKVEHNRNFAASTEILEAQRGDFRLVEKWAKRSEELKYKLQECQGG